ncbi:MAG TPA: pitrilysin family protein [Pyrinomonadaceae bacterium]|jgi:zinc protease|nr:pitrilysin family protein [Pyrinomonadaceae bacterium]
MKFSFLIKKLAFIALLTGSLGVVASTQALQQPRKESLLNGLKVLTFNDPKAGKVWIKLRVHAGSAFDPRGKEGVMQMLAMNIFPTDAAHDYFSQDLGGGLDVTTNYDYIEIDISAAPGNLIAALETLGGAVSNPVIDKETTARLKAEMLVKVKTLEADPDRVADAAAAKRLFGTFPYGRPLMGTEASLNKIDFVDLMEAKSRFLTADDATITISGNFDRSLAIRGVKRFFGGWVKADKRVPSTFAQPEIPPVGVQTLVSPIADRFAIRYAMRGTSRYAKDMAAADVFARIMEARLKTRVPVALSASVFARADANVLPGWVVIGFSGAKNDIGAGNGKIEANELIAKALGDAITDAEFRSARAAAVINWSGRGADQFWLDVDTYSTVPQTDRAAFDTVTIGDVRDFALWVATQPSVTVLVNTPK